MMASTSTPTVTTDVAIVGMGPVGDVLAGLLARRGIQVLAIDREPKPYGLPRAATFDHEVMRVFQELGVANAIKEDTRQMSAFELVNAARETLMYFSVSDTAVSGWAQSFLCHQPSIEDVLRRRLSEMPEIDLRLSHTFVGIVKNDDEGVVCEIKDAQGELLTVSAKFLIGCDGGSSPVRTAADMGLFDYGFEEPWLVIDVLMSDETGLASHCIQLCDPARPTTALPMAPGRRRWEFMLLPGETTEQVLSDSFIAGLLDKHVAAERVKVVRKAVYRFHGLVAESWRSGSVLLAGDAAHQMPPFLGQGMCSGIRDAANLAWKLAMVFKGEAGLALLDTYQQERSAHVRGIVERAIEIGRMICTLDPKVADERDTGLFAARKAGAPPPDVQSLIPTLAQGCLYPSHLQGELFPQPFVTNLDGAMVRLDDITGDQFVLITTGTVPRDLPPYLKGIRIRDQVRNAIKLEEWFAATGTEAVLVRPDRYIFGTGESQQLIDQLRISLAG